MLVNADFLLPAVITPDAYRWIPSPQVGIERVMLDRIGGEIARATSIVRYAPRSDFPRHQHPGGEEILVLSGTFSDETRDFPAGWYLRNPPGSSHRPSSFDGAMIFVKLCQMQPRQSSTIRIDTKDPTNWSDVLGYAVCQLYADCLESVSLIRLQPGQAVPAGMGAAVEMLVLEGALVQAPQQYVNGSWLRFPGGHRLLLAAGDAGATIYMKTTPPQDSVS